MGRTLTLRDDEAEILRFVASYVQPEEMHRLAQFITRDQLIATIETYIRRGCRFTLIAETGRVRHFRALPETRLFSRHPNWDWRPIFVHLKWD
jgi:hypothetical protein